MNSEVYLVYQGMRARQRSFGCVSANNIANASTTGFKADRLLYRSVEAAQLEAQKQQQQQPATANAANSNTQQPSAEAQPEDASSAINGRTAREMQMMKDRNVTTAGATD
ncbi:MAG: flagellar basal body protein [Pyrinomonadaceae bacterium]